jgi:hypothetical protein
VVSFAANKAWDALLGMPSWVSKPLKWAWQRQRLREAVPSASSFVLLENEELLENE